MIRKIRIQRQKEKSFEHVQKRSIDSSFPTTHNTGDEFPDSSLNRITVPTF